MFRDGATNSPSPRLRGEGRGEGLHVTGEGLAAGLLQLLLDVAVLLGARADALPVERALLA